VVACAPSWGNMTTAVRWGIAGTGTIASLFAEGLADSPGAELVAVASRSPDRANAFASRAKAKRAHGSYDSLANDPGVDIVYIATPNSDHCARAMMMLERGKAVLCEKPFTLDADEARKVIELAVRKRIFCMEAMWMRFMPAVRELASRVREGALGDARAATIELGHPTAFDAAHRVFDPALGGGALLDLGVYAVSLSHLLFGPVTSVKSQVTFAPSGVDDHVTALLGHAQGRQATIGASLRTRLSNGASVSGTTAWARLHEPLYRPDAITIAAAPAAVPGRISSGLVARARRSAALRTAAAELRSMVPPALRGGGRTIRRRYRGNGYCHQAIEAMRCLRAGDTESPVMPLSETLRVMETLDAIRRGWDH
jgi:predicted dehydrogenase